MPKEDQASPSTAAVLEPLFDEASAADKDGRVRKVITRRGRRFRAKFPSRKLGRYVHAESPLENDAVRHIEYSPTTVSYQEQPEIVRYLDETGKLRKYYPDFLVKRADGSEELIEVKSRRELNKPDIRRKYSLIALQLEEARRRFVIWTEEYIRQEPRYTNLSRIHDAVRCIGPVNLDHLPLLEWSGRTVLFRELLKELGSERAVFLHYLAGHICLDIDSPDLSSSQVSVK